MNIEVYSLYNQMNTHIYQNADIVEENNSFTVIDNYTNKKREYPYSGYNWHELTPREEEILEIHSNSIQDAKLIIEPFEPNTLTINNCDKIILTEKGINVKVEIKVENFDDIEYIVINDYKFKRER